MSVSLSPDHAGLVFHGVDKAYGETDILRGVSWQVAPGTVGAILGANGAGKSTLLRLLATLGRPDRGSIQIAGIDACKTPAGARRRLGYLGHLSLLTPDLTARENLRVLATLHGVARARVAEVLGQLRLERWADDLVRTYSRGMEQRLALARALLHDPPVLLLDEPYTGLDEASAVALGKAVHGWRAQGRAILMVTHDFRVAAALADRVAFLVRGRLIEAPKDEHEGAPENALSDPETLLRAYRAKVSARPVVPRMRFPHMR